MDNFSIWLKEQRKLKGWSLYKLQQESGISRQAIFNIEAGGDVKLSTAKELCKALERQYTLGKE